MDAGEGAGAALDGVLANLLDDVDRVPVNRIRDVVQLAGRALGADQARMLVADYGLTSLQELGDDGPRGPAQPIEGTLAGRCFASGQTVVSSDATTVWIVLAEGSERLGVLELGIDPSWSEQHRPTADVVVRVLVLLLISRRRYTDVVLRSRRAEPLSIAAEIQWSLLPPLTCASDQISASGILEPAYSIGGDTFDWAQNAHGLEFAIIDAVGHGLPAVSISVVALNGLRNARREGHDLARAYRDTDAALREQFVRSAFATGQFGSLDHRSGELTWINAGHPLPLLVRDGNLIGELPCRPSLPMGWGGPVTEVATAQLQPGDRVLFYTDGVVESRSPDGDVFGVDRLADLLVRASTDGTPPAECVRRLAATVLEYNGRTLRDDATLFMLEYHGADRAGAGEGGA